jgi:hypothetical protein
VRSGDGAAEDGEEIADGRENLAVGHDYALSPAAMRD